MEYHLDKRLVLSRESPHPSLYTWFIRELDDAGEQQGRDLIPWSWSQYFEVADIKLVVSAGVKPDYDSKDPEAVSAQHSRIITARLGPEWDRGGRLLNRQTTYSMMGTDRTDVRFELVVRPANEDSDIGCRVWGSPSYTHELDFRNSTTKDDVVFDLTVDADTFAFYAELIAGSGLKAGRLRLSGVSGFYSDWSPSISTDFVKILTEDDSSHPVEVPEGTDIKPPRLGRVREASLDLWQELVLIPETPQVDAFAEPDYGQSDRLHTPPASVGAPAADRLVKIAASLRIALWVIAALLVVLVFK